MLNCRNHLSSGLTAVYRFIFIVDALLSGIILLRTFNGQHGHDVGNYQDRFCIIYRLIQNTLLKVNQLSSIMHRHHMHSASRRTIQAGVQ